MQNITENIEEMSASKGKRLTKEEVALLINLIETNKVITNKTINSKTNHLKELAWAEITETFNASISSGRRNSDQLRLKWDNLKKAARKRSALIKRNNMKNGGVPDIYIKRDYSLDRVLSMLDTGHKSGDSEDSSSSCETSPDCSPTRQHTDDTLKHFGIQNVKQKLLEEDVKSRISRNRSIANYYTLKIKKIELEMEFTRLQNEKLNKIEKSGDSEVKFEPEIILGTDDSSSSN